ncbi:MAG: hypothetical protein WCG31_02515 [Deltaproteobacteria bacterium]
MTDRFRAPPKFDGANLLEEDAGTRKILCCMTVYNEPAPAIIVSLYALFRNLVCLCRHSEGFRDSEFAVCILVDGVDRMSRSARSLFSNLGFVTESADFETNNLVIRRRVLRLQDLEVQLNGLSGAEQESRVWLDNLCDSLESGGDPGNEFSPEDVGQGLDVLLCLKRENLGKLDSHWWFFAVICGETRPGYCIQIDAGTAPRQDAVLNLYRFFELNPRAGAAASMILISRPKSVFDPLHAWQFGDVLYQRLLGWPAEVLAGYLSVVPGQFSFLRLRAVIGDTPQEAPDRLPCADLAKIPASNYFRGLGRLDSFQSTMFLAEDRILGFEVISTPQNLWQLVYLPSAISVTDPCETLAELLQQRRRWYNSEFSCNIWLLANIRSLIVSQKMTRNRLLLLFTAQILLITCFLEYTLPALSILFALVLRDTCMAGGGFSAGFCGLASLLADALVALSIVQIAVFSIERFRVARKSLFCANGVVQVVLFALAILLLFRNDSVFGNSLLFAAIVAAEAFSGLLLAMIYSKSIFKGFARSSLPFFLLHPMMLVQLRTYSFCNFHDVSWGTKGLKKGEDDENGEAPHQSRARCFPLLFLACWVATNVALVGWSYHLSGEGRSRLFNLFLSLVGILTFLRMLGGATTFVRYFISRSRS